MTNKTLLKFSFKYLFITAIFLAAVHAFLVYNIDRFASVHENWWIIHLFLMGITLIGVTLISKSYQKTGEVRSIGKMYLLYTTVKILLALLFLTPWILVKDQPAKDFIMHFFAIFFPFLMIETLLLIRYLNGPVGENLRKDEIQSTN